MRSGRRGFAFFLAMPLAACGLLGPVLDRSMDHAPFQACHRFGAEAPASGAGPAPQCLDMLRRAGDGSWQPFASDRIRAGDALVATVSAAPGCQGNFTHVTVTGSAAGAGRMLVAVPDGLARGEVGRIFRWDAATGPRQWTLGNVNRTLNVPAGLRIVLIEGEVRLDEACFKSYRRPHDREPVPAAHAGE